MPGMATKKIKDKSVTKHKFRSSDEDIIRPPSRDLSSSGDESYADIKPAFFKRSSQESNTRQIRDEVNEKSSIVGLQSGTGYNGVNSYRLKRGIGTSTKSYDTISTINAADREHYGPARNNLVDIFGKAIHRETCKQAVYGRTSQPSSQNTVSSQSFSSPKSQASPKRKFKRVKIPISDSENSDNEILSTFKPPSSELLDYESSEDFESDPSKVYVVSAYGSRTPDPVSNQKFNNDLTDTTYRNDFQLPKYKQSMKFENTYAPSFDDPSFSIDGLVQEPKNILVDVRAKLLLDNCNSFNFESDDNTPTSSNTTSLSLDTGDNDDPLSLAPIARCPMCNVPVSPNGLRSQGNMNTRRQEQFCLAHRKKEAKKQWQTNHYPTINWNNLDTRISKHHLFLKDLINGKDSFYRSILQEKVDQGRDRNLRTTTTSLIPGYYGLRGLHIISENVFRKFTPLLRKRIVQDRLIAARGYTPYVQSVLVPEVAVLLIQEDMQISAVEARDIMAESATVGELLHEESRDIFKTTGRCEKLEHTKHWA